MAHVVRAKGNDMDGAMVRSIGLARACVELL